MEVYGYNGETMEYTGPVTCQLDPVRSKREGREIFLRPADSTETRPPEFNPESQRAVYDFISDSWTVEDKPASEPDPPAPEPGYTADDMFRSLLGGTLARESGGGGKPF